MYGVRRTMRALLPSGETRRLGRMLAIYAAVGTVSGLAAIGFAALVELSSEVVLGPLTRERLARAASDGDWLALITPAGIEWLIVIVPAAGGLICGLIATRFSGDILGSGTALVIDTYHRQQRESRARVPFLKFLATPIAIGSGASGGLEGPIGQICAGLATIAGKWLRLSPADRRTLLMAGFAAGIGALFHAPMAAAIFAGEVLYRKMDIEHEVLIPAIITSTISFAVYGTIGGWEPIVTVPPVSFEGPTQLLPYTALALALAAIAMPFMRLEEWVRTHLGTAPSIPRYLRPALGGLGVGLIGLFLPHVLGTGYGIAQLALDGSAPVWLLLTLAVAKVVASTLSIGSGGPVGYLSPSLVIGAAIGGVVGTVTNQLAPGLDAQPAAFVVVGMAGFFAAISNAPLSTVILVCELVGNYQLVVPALWVCTIAWLFSRRRSLFDTQVPTRFDVPFRLGDMLGAVLHRITVREALDPNKPPAVTVRPDQHLREIVEAFAHSSQAAFPILDPASGLITGVVDGPQLRRVVGEGGLNPLLIATDFESPAVTIRLDETLYEAVNRMTSSNFDELVVVDPAEPRKLVGLLSRRELITAYHRRMLSGTPLAAPGQVISRPPTDDLPDLYGAVRHGSVVRAFPARSRFEALEYMVHHAHLPEAVDRAWLVELLLSREALGSTALGDGVAVPHPHAELIPGLEHPCVIIGLSRKPIPWEAFDGVPVDTVCMLLCPSGDIHLDLLGALARAVHDPILRKLLKRRASTRRIRSRFRELQEASARG